MRVLVAPDKFKGSLTAAAAAEAIAAGLRQGLMDVEVLLAPLADGGDGTVDAAVAAGYERVLTTVTGPTAQPVVAGYAIRGGTAVVELAEASGLRRLPGGRPAPLTATTFGTGELLRAALDAGAAVGGVRRRPGAHRPGTRRGTLPAQRVRAAHPAGSDPHRDHVNDRSPMQRICFTLQVRPDRLAEYRRRHAAVAPDMLRALAETGWRDYSLFLRSDGLLVGYLVADDFEAAQAALARTEASRRWEESMADFFVEACAEDKRPLQEVFHLEDQLARLNPDLGQPADRSCCGPQSTRS